MWRDIKGFEGLYQVSDMGEIRSKRGIRKQGTDKDGYKTIVLVSRPKFVYSNVQRIVWEAFNGPIPKGMQINHINEDKTDNRLCNLNLMTPKENINWGTGKYRSAKSRCKRIMQYTEDGNEVFCFFSISEAAKELGICVSSISSAINGRYQTAGGYKWKKLNM